MSIESLYSQLQMEYSNVTQELRLYRMFCGPMDMTNPSFLSRLTMGQQGISVVPSIHPSPAPAPLPAPPAIHNQEIQPVRSNYAPRGRGNGRGNGRGGNRGNRGGKGGRGGRFNNGRQFQSKKPNIPDTTESGKDLPSAPVKVSVKQQLTELRQANAAMMEQLNAISAERQTAALNPTNVQVHSPLAGQVIPPSNINKPSSGNKRRAASEGLPQRITRRNNPSVLNVPDEIEEVPLVE